MVEVAFIQSFNKQLILCSVPGSVMGPGESGEWKVSDSLTSCSVPREACVALETLMGEASRPPRNAPSQSQVPFSPRCWVQELELKKLIARLKFGQ